MQTVGPSHLLANPKKLSVPYYPPHFFALYFYLLHWYIGSFSRPHDVHKHSCSQSWVAQNMRHRIFAYLLPASGHPVCNKLGKHFKTKERLRKHELVVPNSNPLVYQSWVFGCLEVPYAHPLTLRSQILKPHITLKAGLFLAWQMFWAPLTSHSLWKVLSSSWVKVQSIEHQICEQMQCIIKRSRQSKFEFVSPLTPLGVDQTTCTNCSSCTVEKTPRRFQHTGKQSYRSLCPNCATKMGRNLDKLTRSSITHRSTVTIYTHRSSMMPIECNTSMLRPFFIASFITKPMSFRNCSIFNDIIIAWRGMGKEGSLHFVSRTDCR